MEGPYPSHKLIVLCVIVVCVSVIVTKEESEADHRHPDDKRYDTESDLLV